jgi:hypothetical protein
LGTLTDHRQFARAEGDAGFEFRTMHVDCDVREQLIFEQTRRLSEFGVRTGVRTLGFSEFRFMPSAVSPDVSSLGAVQVAPSWQVHPRRSSWHDRGTMDRTYFAGLQATSATEPCPPSPKQRRTSSKWSSTADHGTFRGWHSRYGR